jgi:DNA-binding transcriptional regulator of glucitol operon
MARSFRFAGRPIWLAGHLLVLAAATTMVLLGHWQLGVSEHKGFSLQNFGYALQWWAFSLFALVLWTKILRDRSAAGRPAAPTPLSVGDEPVTYRRYVMPQSADGPIAAEDPEQAAYNAYLAQLGGQSEVER